MTQKSFDTLKPAGVHEPPKASRITQQADQYRAALLTNLCTGLLSVANLGFR